MDNIKKVLEVLGSVDVFYLATSVDGKPNVRPFDVHTDFEGKVYLVTKKQKNVYKELKENPYVAVARATGHGYFRIYGQLIEDDRREALEKMYNDNVELCKGKYEVDDETTAVFYFKDATLNLMEHGKEPVVIEF